MQLDLGLWTQNSLLNVSHSRFVDILSYEQFMKNIRKALSFNHNSHFFNEVDHIQNRT